MDADGGSALSLRAETGCWSIGQRIPQLSSDVWLAPTAIVIGSVVLHRGVSVWFNAVLRGDDECITIGEGTNIQDGAVIHADAGIPVTVGRWVTIGHQATIHGATIGDDCLIGIGAVVLNGATVGAGSLVAAGALVPEGFEAPPGSLILGSPAKIRRDLGPAEVQAVKDTARDYRDNAELYRRSFRPFIPSQQEDLP
nr:gamma carbonic anhydrase family protein [uncultured Aeromicrobium sp.]